MTDRSTSDIEGRQNRVSSSWDGRATHGGVPGGRRRLRQVFSGTAKCDVMFLEEMYRQVSVREGGTIERTPLMRAAIRAIGLKTGTAT
jgi:hypothetical protein